MWRGGEARPRGARLPVTPRPRQQHGVGYSIPSAQSRLRSQCVPCRAGLVAPLDEVPRLVSLVRRKEVRQVVRRPLVAVLVGQPDRVALRTEEERTTTGPHAIPRLVILSAEATED